MGGLERLGGLEGLGSLEGLGGRGLCPWLVPLICALHMCPSHVPVMRRNAIDSSMIPSYTCFMCYVMGLEVLHGRYY